MHDGIKYLNQFIAWLGKDEEVCKMTERRMEAESD